MEMTREEAIEILEEVKMLDDSIYAYNLAYGEALVTAIEMLKAQEPPKNASISSAIECLLHPQDADDSDMAKAIDTAVRAMRSLRDREPRVMTLEEVAGYVALERETTIYMEFGCLAIHSGQVIGLNPKYMYFDDENGLSWDVCEGPDQGKKDGVALCEYNDIWRCWTRMPTRAQREAEAWA